MIEIKIALCKILLNFEILPLKDDKKGLELQETLVRVPKNGVKVQLGKRN